MVNSVTPLEEDEKGHTNLGGQYLFAMGASKEEGLILSSNESPEKMKGRL